MAVSVGVPLVLLNSLIATLDTPLEITKTDEADSFVCVSDVRWTAQLIGNAVADEGPLEVSLFEFREGPFEVGYWEKRVLFYEDLRPFYCFDMLFLTV